MLLESKIKSNNARSLFDINVQNLKIKWIKCVSSYNVRNNILFFKKGGGTSLSLFLEQ
jgi:hypothetical protein